MGFAAAGRAYMHTDDQEIINIPIRLPGTMALCSGFHSNPSNSWCDISVWSAEVDTYSSVASLKWYSQRCQGRFLPCSLCVICNINDTHNLVVIMSSWRTWTHRVTAGRMLHGPVPDYRCFSWQRFSLVIAVNSQILTSAELIAVMLTRLTEALLTCRSQDLWWYVKPSKIC